MGTVISIKSIPKPPPKWFRITNEIISYTEDFILAFLMLKGHQSDSFWLLAIKLASSFVRKICRAMLSGNEVYATDTGEQQKAA